MRQENKEWWYNSHIRPEDWQIREAVRLYEEEGWTLAELGKKFNRAQSGIWRWINIFAKELDNPDMNKKKIRASKQRERARKKFGVLAPEQTPQHTQPSESQAAESAEQKIRRLEKELADARLARDFYNEMINVAERQFNINIRKKAGTRQ